MSSTISRRIFSLSPDAFEAGVTDPDIDIYPEVTNDLVILRGCCNPHLSPVVDKQRSANLAKTKITLTYKIRANTLAQREAYLFKPRLGDYLSQQ
jgi:hypothetical protein